MNIMIIAILLWFGPNNKSFGHLDFQASSWRMFYGELWASTIKDQFIDSDLHNMRRVNRQGGNPLTMQH